ncbi:hypothetical protein [Streptomyces amakusaensis]|uniref:Uncharacterized protein n=1 Tax=Streptomyces amakusaensis TaxID=67271 RepID=A0ABW0AVV2_9ACTN
MARARTHAGRGRWERALADYLECGENMSAQTRVLLACATRPSGSTTATSRCDPAARSAG